MRSLFRNNRDYMRPYHWVLEGLSIVLGIAAIVAALVGRSKLPDQVPTHWDFQGNPNGYGSPSTFVLFPVIMLLVILTTSLILHFVDIEHWNMPFQVKTGRKVPVARALMTSLFGMNVELGAFSLWFTLRTVSQAMTGTVAAMVLFVAALSLTLLLGIGIAAMRNK